MSSVYQRVIMPSHLQFCSGIDTQKKLRTKSTYKNTQVLMWAGEKKKPFESSATVWLFIEPCPSKKETLAYSVLMGCHGMKSSGGSEGVSH